MSYKNAAQVFSRLRHLCRTNVHRYQSDWAIDETTINALFDQSDKPMFIHVARENGTYLFPILTKDLDVNRPYLFSQATGRQILRQQASLFTGSNPDNWGEHKIHHFDGYLVKLISCEAAHKILADAANTHSQQEGVAHHAQPI